MSTITGGELLLRALQAEGITQMFGILDGSFNPFLAKLDDYGIRFINTRHEAAAAHMADAYARISGQPAVAIGGIGPGAANMLSGVITASAEGSPVIAISGQRRTPIIYPDRGGSFQNVPLIDLYRPVTKWAGGVRHWHRLPEMVRHAFRAALSGRPGPVYLEIPEDIMRAEGEPDAVPIWQPRHYRPGRPGGDPDAIRRAATILCEARLPHLHAGTGLSWAGAWDDFLDLADHLGATLTTSLGARGIVPEDHPRYLAPLNRAGLETMRREADVVLVAGSRVGELDTWGKAPSWGEPGTQKVIHVDIDPLSIGLNRPVDVAINGDAAAVVPALLQAVRSRADSRLPTVRAWEELARFQHKWQEQLDGAVAGDQLNPGQVVRAVRDFFPRDAITVLDGGNTTIWGVSYHPIYQPRSFLFTAHFGHLGTGLPYALGARMAAPDRPVCLISGDGAIGFNLQELETARRYDLPVTVVVIADRGWGMERSSQMFARIGGMVETELFPGARYDKVAEAFGCYGALVTSLDELKPALRAAADSGLPALVQVMVEPGANLAPPGLMDFGNMVYRGTD
jgi:acetolactate synthase I/II/III large subunit